MLTTSGVYRLGIASVMINSFRQATYSRTSILYSRDCFLFLPWPGDLILLRLQKVGMVINWLLTVYRKSPERSIDADGEQEQVEFFLLRFLVILADNWACSATVCKR